MTNYNERRERMTNPTTLDEAIRLFKGYIRGENGFDELDLKEWLIEWREQEIAEARQPEREKSFFDNLPEGGPHGTSVIGFIKYVEGDKYVRLSDIENFIKGRTY